MNETHLSFYETEAEEKAIFNNLFNCDPRIIRMKGFNNEVKYIFTNKKK